MSLGMTIRPAAEADIQEIFHHLELVRADLGKQFTACLREVFERIEAAPESCGIVWQDVRAVRVRRFQYVVYYVSVAGRVEVLAVLHGARDESAWRLRIEQQE